MTNCTSKVYVENETGLSQPIELGAIYDENKTRKRHDWSYRCALYGKQNWAIVTDRTECGL